MKRTQLPGLVGPVNPHVRQDVRGPARTSRKASTHVVGKIAKDVGRHDAPRRMTGLKRLRNPPRVRDATSVTPTSSYQVVGAGVTKSSRIRYAAEEPFSTRTSSKKRT